MAVVTTTPGQQTRDSTNPEGKWEVLEGCTLVTNPVVDGDSFQVQHKDRTYIFRLYFVDAPEADVSLRDRIQDQAAYFGISTADIPRAGKLAAQFTRERLTGREFTVVTRWQNAMGRSTLARFYCITLVKGENLAEQLVANGWARIYGLRANWPDGTRSTTVINKLKNLELTGREQQRGVWDEKSFTRMAVGADGTMATASGGTAGGKISSGTIDVNEASAEELQRLPGIGPRLAERIMANRPYHKVDDLLKVSGIGPKSIERFRALVRVEGAEGNELEKE
jgi:competence protein ComEA